MLDYNKIHEIFGAPLNTVIRPNVPFKLKSWHIIVGIAGAYIVYKGVKSIKQDYRLNFAPKFKKEIETE